MRKLLMYLSFLQRGFLTTRTTHDSSLIKTFDIKYFITWLPTEHQIVDPAMVEDPEGQFVHEIVLSYTFHETPLPEEQAALETPAEDATAVN